MSRVEEWIAAVSSRPTSGATDDALDATAEQLGIVLPADYRAMMRAVNGGDAEFGNSWVVICRIEDLAERDAALHIDGYAAGFTIFGGNGGGEAYAWDWRPDREAMYVVIPLIGLAADQVVPCGDSLEEFFDTLHGGIPFQRHRL